MDIGSGPEYAVPAKPMKPEEGAGIAFAVFFVFFLIVILFFFLALPCGGCNERFSNCNCSEGFNNLGIKSNKSKKENFHTVNNMKPMDGREFFSSQNEQFQVPQMPGSLNYNSAYTSPDLSMNGSFLYTQPPGDVRAQEFGRSGQGTSGSFFPIQGNGAPTYMKNSAPNNLAIPSPDPGQIGGQDNYTTKLFTTGMNGFQNFGSPFAFQRGPQVFEDNYSNSYLITGGNQRVRNPGESRRGNLALECGSWWPTVGGSNCVNGNSDLPDCKEGNVEKCVRFLQEKMTPEWMKVVSKAN